MKRSRDSGLTNPPSSFTGRTQVSATTVTTNVTGIALDGAGTNVVTSTGDGNAVTLAAITDSADADLTVFDPDTVTDNATMQDGGLPSSGIPYVLVNGVTVVRGGENVDDVFPGQPVHGHGLAA